MNQSKNEQFTDAARHSEENWRKSSLTPDSGHGMLLRSAVLYLGVNMLVNPKDAEKRLNSPDNLMNRLRASPASSRSNQAKSAMSLFVPTSQEIKPNPFASLQLTTTVNQPEPPSVYNPPSDEIEESPDKAAGAVLDELEVKIKRETIQSAALDVLSKSVQALGTKITAGEVHKPKDLADIARKMSGIVTDIKKGEDSKDKDGKTVHLHFYTPERKKLSDFEVIDVG